MFRNYFTTAFRNLATNRLYSAINIGGLALGLAACILILTASLLLALFSPLYAQSGSEAIATDKNPADFKRIIGRLQQGILQQEDKIAEAQDTERNILAELEVLDKKLVSQQEKLRDLEEKMKKQGMKKIDNKYLSEYLQPSALNEVKWYQIKSEILKKEKLEVSDSELEEQAKADAEKTGLPIDKLMNYYKSSNQLERMLDKKLFDFLKEKNEIKKVNPDKLAQKQKEEKV